MKIKFLSGVALGGGVDAYEGDELEVPEHQAFQLIARGKAVEVAGETPKKPAKK